MVMIRNITASATDKADVKLNESATNKGQLELHNTYINIQAYLFSGT